MTVPSAVRTTRELFLQNQVNYQCFSEYHYNNGAERVGELWRMQLGWQNHLFLPSIALALAMSHGKVDHRALECKREFFSPSSLSYVFSPLPALRLLVFLSLQIQGSELKEALGVMEEWKREDGLLGDGKRQICPGDLLADWMQELGNSNKVIQCTFCLFLFSTEFVF